MVSVLCDLSDLPILDADTMYRYWYKSSVLYINCAFTYTKVSMVSVLSDLSDLHYSRCRYWYWYNSSVFYINCVVTYTKVDMVSVFCNLF